MAGPHTRRNTSGIPTNDSSILVPIPAVSRVYTPAPAQTSTPAPASVPGPLGRYTNEDLQRATKLALKLFVKGQKYNQLQASSVPCKQLLKAQVFRPVL